MYQWDKYNKKRQEQLRNLQIAREDQWKEDMLVKFQQAPLEHNAAFNDIVDEHSIWFSTATTKYLEQITNQDNSRFPEWVHQALNLGPDRISYIVVSSAMEMIYSSFASGEDNPYSNVWSLPTAQSLARAISEKAWDVASWLQAKRADPFFYRYQQTYFKNWNNKRRKAFAKKVNALPKATMREKDNFGHAMVRLAMDAGLLEGKIIAEKKVSKKKTKMNRVLYVTLPEAMINYMMGQIDEYAARLLPNRLPMLCRPVSHTETETGGVMDWSIRKLRHTTSLKDRPDEEMLRDVDPSCMSPMTRKVINTLQNSEWRINTRVLEVCNNLWMAGRETGTIPPYDSLMLDQMPAFPEEGSKTEQHAWMDEKSRRWAKWAKGQASRLQMQIRMHEAYKLKPFVLWHAYFCDFRGRYYSDSYLLHPQGADLDKSLIMAAEPEQVSSTGLYWIKVNLANLMGVDKVCFDDRVKYVDDHMDDWRAVVADPEGTTSLWEDDAPKKNASFQRLAAIFDLILAIDEGMTQVPVQVDGSCNGIQHWAAMTRDETIGPEVNLTPGEKPADVYQLVADGCTEMCMDNPSDWRNHFLDQYEGRIPRKVVKRSVMCDPYGISDHSVRSYVLQEKHLEWCEDKSLNIRQGANEMGTLIIESKNRLMAHCNHGKLFVQLLCGWVDDQAGKPLSWLTPSGFRVINKYNPRATKQSKIRMWDKQFFLAFGYYTDDYDGSKAMTATPPNFVHSLDAAHMSLVVDRLVDMGVEFFSMIHDSFGCMANNMSMLREVTKDTFYEIHQTDQLTLFRESAEAIVGERLPEEHPSQEHDQRGRLDIRDVLDSDYLFG